jgi:hypothetical protein
VKRPATCRPARIAYYGAFPDPVSKTPLSELLEALKSLKSLQETVGKHDEVLTRILDRLDSIDERLAAFEKAAEP